MKVFSALFVFLSLAGMRSLGQSLQPVEPIVNFNPSTLNGQSKDYIPASPNAASLGIFGQVPVSHYTGIPQIGVPLYSISYKDLNVPISLGYYASGNKPDAFPGSTGLGWSLQAGGAITRVIKGLPDYEISQAGSYFVPYLLDPTEDSDWHSNFRLGFHLQRGYNAVDDNGTPDEFNFSLNGASGKFYVGDTVTCVLAGSTSTYYRIKMQALNTKVLKMPTLVQDGPSTLIYKDTLVKSRLIYQFVLTDDQGVRYTFGGTDESIEFSRPGFSSSNVPDTSKRNWYINAVTWNLTSIESPNGYKIALQYDRTTFVTKVGYCDVTKGNWLHVNIRNAPIARGEKSTLINGSNLRKIITPKEVVDFNYSDAGQQLHFPLDTLFKQNNDIAENRFDWYRDVGSANTQVLVPVKVDSVIVRDKSNAIYKRIGLSYTSDTLTRLKLTGVAIAGGKSLLNRMEYHFSYNPLSLPSYLSYKTDHYGFYNGRNTYITSNNPNDYLSLDSALFTHSKDPDTAYVQAELLTKITYPTGGSTRFEYEPNTYSSYVTTWPFGVAANASNANIITGGVRIKRITSYDSPDHVASEKKYYYTKDYKHGGIQSSGVLTYKPVYFDSYSGTVTPPLRTGYQSPTYFTGPVSYWHWTTNPIYPMGAPQGSHITYSEVTEVDPDSGFVVYRYKNYDNGYSDKEPINYACDHTTIKEFWKEDAGNSMDLERGQLAQQEVYDANKTLKLKDVLVYNDDTARFNHNKRVLTQTANSLNSLGILSYRLTATYLYTYLPYLKQKTSYQYSGTDSMVTTVTNTVDEDYRLLKKQVVTSSAGKQLTTINSYPKDLVDSGQTVPFQVMIDRGMTGMLVTKEQKEDSVLMGKSIIGYRKNISQDTTLILPYNYQTQFKSRAPEVRRQNELYNKAGNILSSSVEKGAKTCYVWGYGNSYPIAKIVNAAYSTIDSILGGRVIVDSFAALMPASPSVYNAYLAPLRSDSALSDAMISTFTYYPLTGVRTETDPNGFTTYYDYDDLGRLILVRDQNMRVIKKICYNYAGQPGNCFTNRINIDTTILGRTTVKSEICTTAPILQIATVYSAGLQASGGNVSIGDDSIGIVEPDSTIPSGYFGDPNLTTPLQDGYYKNNSGRFPSNEYFYVLNGKYLYTNVCGGADPALLRYTDSLPTPQFMCDNDSLPMVAAFKGTDLLQGSHLYSNYGLTIPVADGYYGYDDKHFKVTNGVIDTVKSCLPPDPDPPVLHSILLRRGSSLATICARPSFPFWVEYFYVADELSIGVYLHYIYYDFLTDTEVDAPAAAGYYSDGTLRISVNSDGIIDFIGTCF